MGLKSYTIYAIQCVPNKKVYIGCSRNFIDRIKAHFWNLRGQRHIAKGLQADFNEYGIDNFAVFVLEEHVEYEDRREREAYWIAKYRASNPNYGYNTRSEKLSEIPVPIYGLPEPAQNPSVLYDNVKSLCQKRKISISKLEKDLGLGNATIQKWQTSTPRVGTIKAVADYFGTTVDELLTKEDDSDD